MLQVINLYQYANHRETHLLLDSHIHLTDLEYSGYLNYILTGLYKMGICACSVTVDVASSIRSFELFNGHREIIKQFIGIHPEASGRENIDSFVELFEKNITNISGVGEIGLDRNYVGRGASYEKQNQVFLKMLELAEKNQKPVSIHSRSSLDDVLSILPSYRLKSALLHWFAGSKKQLTRCMEMDGVFVSFGPALLYAQDKKTLLMASNPDRVLIETDGPVKYSRCFTGYPSISTSFLVSVLAEVAKIFGERVEVTTQRLERIAKAYLQL